MDVPEGRGRIGAPLKLASILLTYVHWPHFDCKTILFLCQQESQVCVLCAARWTKAGPAFLPLSLAAWPLGLFLLKIDFHPSSHSCFLYLCVLLSSCSNQWEFCSHFKICHYSRSCPNSRLDAVVLSWKCRKLPWKSRKMGFLDSTDFDGPTVIFYVQLWL